MTFRNLINISIILSAMGFFFELLLTYDNGIYGLSTFLLLLFFLLIIFIFNNYSGVSDSLKTLFIILIFLWILFRLHILLLLPHTFSFKNILTLNTSNLNYSILLITMSTIVMFVGLRMGEIFNNSLKNKIVHTKPYKFLGGFSLIFTVLVFSFILSFITSYITIYTYGSGRGGGSPYLLAILSRILNRGFIFILLSSFVINKWNQISNHYKIIYYLILLLQILSLIFISASKGAIFWTFFWILICFLSSNFNISKLKLSKSIFILIIPTIILSISLFNFGNQLRYVLSGTLKGVNVNISKVWENREKLEQFSYGGDFFKESLLVSISKRLSQFDYLAIMFNIEPRHPEYYSIAYTIKNIANQIMPGLPYPDVIHVARLFRVSYGIKSFNNAFNQYHTDMIPYFGHLFLMTGGILFFPIIFFTGAIFSLLYSFYSRNKELYMQRTICLYLFYTLIFQMGIDSFFGEVLFFIILPILGFRLFRLPFKLILPKLKIV